MNRIKSHVAKYKLLYAGVGLGLGFAGITWAIMKEPRAIPVAGVDDSAKRLTGSFSSAKSVFGASTNNVVTTIHNGAVGNPGFVTRCVETGTVFQTQATAARAFDIPESILSKHLNFGLELREGLHFERVSIVS